MLPCAVASLEAEIAVIVLDTETVQFGQLVGNRQWTNFTKLVLPVDLNHAEALGAKQSKSTSAVRRRTSQVEEIKGY